MKVLLCTLALFSAALAAPGIPGERIVGAVDAVRGQFPYIVSLEYCISTICQHACGGAIISRSWIVTAGHCVTGLPALGSYAVHAGILDLNGNNIERESVRVSLSVVHPYYEGGVNPHDIALLKLASPLVFTELVQPILLPPAGKEYNGRVSLSGWGSTGGTIMPNRLQTIDIPIVPIRDCDIALRTVLGTTEYPLDFDANICTGPLFGGISACSGDSGGPLIKTGELVGIVSWGVNPCGTYGAPSVYTKVSRYISWIRSIVDDPMPEL